MFRIIRKWYFKIYHLFKLLGIFILIFGIQKNVYAEVYTTVPYQKNFIISEESCTENKFNPVFVQNAYVEGKSKNYVDNKYSRSSYLIPVKQNTKYSITPMEELVFSYWISFLTTPEGGVLTTSPKGKVTSFTTTGNTNYIIVTMTSYDWTKETPFEIMMNEGETLKPYTPFKTVCKEEPEEPTKNEVYTNFLTIYTDRLIYLANGFTSNPYLIAMIGIIFAWVVLELFLKILNLRGGKYK